MLLHAPVGASAESPIEAHLVAPDGAELRTHPTDGPLHSEHGNFLDGIEGLDVHRQGGARGMVHRDGDPVLITAVRLRDEDEAARALRAFGNLPPDDVVVEVLPEVAPDTITHRITEVVHGREGFIVEVVRATGRDLVVFAQLDLDDRNVKPFTREVLAAHLVAFPAVTAPAAAGPRLGWWLIFVGVGVSGVVAALSLTALRRRRQRTSSVPPAPIEPSRIRVNW